MKDKRYSIEEINKRISARLKPRGLADKLRSALKIKRI